jgi:hypothetical protein
MENGEGSGDSLVRHSTVQLGLLELFFTRALSLSAASVLFPSGQYGVFPFLVCVIILVYPHVRYDGSGGSQVGLHVHFCRGWREGVMCFQVL